MGNYWNPVTNEIEEFKPIKGPEYGINETPEEYTPVNLHGDD